VKKPKDIYKVFEKLLIEKKIFIFYRIF